MAAKLGARTAMVAKVGQDSFGENMIKNFKAFNVDVGKPAERDGETGRRGDGETGRRSMLPRPRCLSTRPRHSEGDERPASPPPTPLFLSLLLLLCNSAFQRWVFNALFLAHVTTTSKAATGVAPIAVDEKGPPPSSFPPPLPDIHHHHSTFRPPIRSPAARGCRACKLTRCAGFQRQRGVLT